MRSEIHASQSIAVSHSKRPCLERIASYCIAIFTHPSFDWGTKMGCLFWTFGCGEIDDPQRAHGASSCHFSWWGAEARPRAACELCIRVVYLESADERASERDIWLQWNQMGNVNSRHEWKGSEFSWCFHEACQREPIEWRGSYDRC